MNVKKPISKPSATRKRNPLHAILGLGSERATAEREKAESNGETEGTVLRPEGN